MERVAGKVAIVSGAASGIGAACARLLAEEGAKVLLVDLNDAAGAQVVAEIEAKGGVANWPIATAKRGHDVAVGVAGHHHGPEPKYGRRW